MIRRFIILFNLLVFATVICYGQRTSSSENPYKKQLLEQANLMGNALMRSDYDTFCKYTHPSVIKGVGGKGEMIKSIVELNKTLKQQGAFIAGFLISNPGKIIKTNNELQCTLQQRVNMVFGKKRGFYSSTLIAISADGGKNWLFATAVNKDLAAMKKVLPNLSMDIVILPTTPLKYYNQK